MEIERSITIYSSESKTCQAYRSGEGEFSLVVVGGNHGDENGPREVFSEMFPIDHEELSVTYIPEANIYASGEGRRETPESFQPNQADERDLNRCYSTALENEERQKLNLTQRAARDILDFLEGEDPDLLVDMHTGTSGTRKMPQARFKHRQEYPVNIEDMRKAAESTGKPVIASTPSADAEMLGAVAPKTEIPAITLEAGGGTEDAFTRKEKIAYREMLEDIIEYCRGKNPASDTSKHSSIQKNFVPDDARGSVSYEVELGDKVEAGETVATVEEEEGVVHEVEALEDGLLETVLAEHEREDVKPGQRLFNLAVK